MAGWDEVLNQFKSQFETVGPEKYVQEGVSPDTSYALADKMMSTLSQGANQVSGIMAKNKAEEISAAEANKKAGYKRVYNKNGGYDFIGPDGQKVSPLEFSMSRGISLTDALQGSYDKADINFLQDMDAMKMDLATGKMDFNQAIDLMSKDYPTMFGRSGVLNPGGANYQTASKQAGMANVEAQYGGTEAKTASERALVSFYNKVKDMGSYNDAIKELGRVESGFGEYSKLKKLKSDEKKALVDRLTEITDQLFYSPSPQNTAKNLPF